MRHKTSRRFKQSALVRVRVLGAYCMAGTLAGAFSQKQ